MNMQWNRIDSLSNSTKLVHCNCSQFVKFERAVLKLYMAWVLSMATFLNPIKLSLL